MSEKTLAKVDYIKPLEDKPYDEVVAEKESYHKEIKNKLISIVQEENVKDDPEVLKKIFGGRKSCDARKAFLCCFSR